MISPVLQSLEYILQGEDLTLLREGIDIECKLAVGKDGKGGLPNAIWETYSAFANTNGGIIILGAKELSDGSFQVVGIDNIQKVKTDFFNNLNNKNKVSLNILADQSVQEWEVDNKKLLLIAVPRASRKQQPIFLNNNPLGHTYFRQHQGDYLLGDEEVKLSLAEQASESRDEGILENFGLADLSSESVRSYRQRYSNLNPGAELNTLSDMDFLRRIGAYASDRKSGIEGLTKAGLLMFGMHHTIMEVFPNYMVDYREQSYDAHERWTDRIVPDGAWSGNLYDFFFKVYRKLSEDLKVPFVLKDGVRQDDTPIHIAVREALVNTLVHADYTERASVLVLKMPDMFRFRNPGLMRVSIEQAMNGGESDCRNRKLHHMFRLINIGEQAGSGIPKILFSWKQQQWIPPYLSEKREPYNQTVLELKKVDLFPAETLKQLEAQFGERFMQLNMGERAALALAKLEGGVIDHASLHAMSGEHSIETTRRLQHLVKLGFLHSSGGRGATYTLDGVEHVRVEDIFGIETSVDQDVSLVHKNLSTRDKVPSLAHKELSTGDKEPSLVHKEPSLVHKEPSLVHKEPSLVHKEPSLVHKAVEIQRDIAGRLCHNLLPLPMIDDDSYLSDDYKIAVYEIAKEARDKRRLSTTKMERIILDLCREQFFTISALAIVLRRNSTSLRINYLAPMTKARKLLLAFPATPTHEKQAYRTNTELESSTKEIENE